MKIKEQMNQEGVGINTDLCSFVKSSMKFQLNQPIIINSLIETEICFEVQLQLDGFEAGRDDLSDLMAFLTLMASQ